MQRARIKFLPSGVSQYLNIASKYYSWTQSTDNIKEHGYIYTDYKDDISYVNMRYWFRLVADAGYRITRMYRTNSTGTDVGQVYEANAAIYPWATGTTGIVNNYLYVEIEEDVPSRLYIFEHNLSICNYNLSGSTMVKVQIKKLFNL